MPSGISSSLERTSGRTDKPSDESTAVALIAMLAADVIALHFDAGREAEGNISIELDGSSAELDRYVLAHRRVSSRRAGRLVVAILRDGSPPAEAMLAVDFGGYAFGPAPLNALCVDLRTFLRERLAPLPRKDRAAVLGLLADVAAADPPSLDRHGLATSMALMREGMREPLLPCVVEHDEPQGLQFDSIIALSERAFYVRGWARDAQADVTRLTVVSPEGLRAELLPGVYRTPRPDVDAFYEQPSDSVGAKPGFISYCETPASSYLTKGWLLEMGNALGVEHEVPGPTVSRDLLGARASILSDLHNERRWDTPLMDHAVPAISRIQAQLDKRTEIEEVFQYGEAPSDPETSVVVPLYGRIDFLEQQLAQFVHDPQLREVDLIYVLDSPTLAPALEVAAGHLFDLYGVPFRTVVLSQNGGYSIANNRGASLARGRLLLLLNSDVVPDQPGWLSQMAEFYGQQGDIGALGPKLLFEDGTLQHAGICFQRPPGGGAWENEHFFKGLHRHLPAANLTRRVPAVSGACLMIDRELYEELGGLRGIYVQGDYEDTDLCLRLRELGRDTWYLPAVELFHLEGQSYALETRRATSRYNIWLHSRLWDAEIESLMAEVGPAAEQPGDS